MKISIHSEINQIPAQSWNALVKDNNPFLRHEFLNALENNHCVGENTGWIPCHIAIHDDQNTLVGAMPLYQKYNSYGEFVFDHAWADAYQRHNLAYYPKLVSAIPYTPASGGRMLSKLDLSVSQTEDIYALLLQTVKQLCKEQSLSGFHCLFAEADEQAWLEKQELPGQVLPELMTRHDCQFHWHNRNYRSFDDFLAGLKPKKRKNIRQERRRVQQQNITLRQLNGHTASLQDWEIFAGFYQQTFLEKGGYPTLNEGFFAEVAQKLPNQTLLILADYTDQQGNTQCVAGSLMYASNSKLYGRHWGCNEQFDKLHFEACYYQGIDYCIENNLQIFEPGAQGEHKIARGFIPTLTKSSHWLNNSPFQEAIEKFIEHEKSGVAHYMKALGSPYKEEP